MTTRRRRGPRGRFIKAIPTASTPDWIVAAFIIGMVVGLLLGLLV